MKDKSGKPLSSPQFFKKVINRLYSYLADFGLMLIRWVGFIPFHCLRKFIYRFAGLKLGPGSAIHMWANFFSLKNIAIGKDSIIGDHIFLDGRAPITIGNHVDIASEVMIYNSQHDVDDPNFAAILAPVVIKDYVFIGPRAIILPGVTIGRGAVVAAGAVVSRNVDPLAVVGGVPATKIRDRRLVNPSYQLGRARLFQ